MPRHLTAAALQGRICCDACQGPCQAVCGVPVGQQLGGHAQFHGAGRVVELVVSHGADQLRHTGTQGLAGRADAAVVDERSQPGQQGTKRGIVHVNDLPGQRRRHVPCEG